jgi:hypothetical protein
MCFTGKEISFDDGKEINVTELLELHSIELLYEELLSHTKSMAQFLRVQRHTHICDDEYVPVGDLIKEYLM